MQDSCILNHRVSWNIFSQSLLLHQPHQCSFLRKLCQWVPWEQKKLFLSFERNLESFQCSRGESQKEMGTCPAKTRNCKKNQKATHQTSEVLKRVYLEPQGQNFAPIQSLLRLETLTCLQEWSWQNWQETVLFLLLLVGFRGHKGKRSVCLRFFKLIALHFICVNENWFSLNYNTIRLIQKAEFFFLFWITH